MTNRHWSLRGGSADHPVRWHVLDSSASRTPDSSPAAGLVPRIIPLVGLIGAPLLLAASVGILFGVIEQVSAWGFLAALLIAAWEIALGFWLVIKGFNADAVNRLDVPVRPVERVEAHWERCRV